MATTQNELRTEKQIDGEIFAVTRNKINYGRWLFDYILSEDLYPSAHAAVWELVKNSFDSIIRLIKAGHSDADFKVELLLVENHPLSPNSAALVIRDNGEGITEETYFFDLGQTNQAGDVTRGLFDKKRIGRLAMLGLTKDKGAGCYVQTAVSAAGPVSEYHLNSGEMAEANNIPNIQYARTHRRLHGLAGASSFTIVVIPNVVDELRDIPSVINDLKWRIPRRPSGYEIKLFAGGQEVAAPKLPNTLVIDKYRDEYGIEGYFELDPGESASGIRICDAETGVIVARAIQMSNQLVFPFGRPELSGDLFIRDVLGHQDTSRNSLSSNLFKSARWKRIKSGLWRYFRPQLIKLLGEEGAITKDPVVQAIRDLVKEMNSVWGSPNQPESENVQGLDSEDEDADQTTGSHYDGPPRPPRIPRPRGERRTDPKPAKVKPSAFPFLYKGQTYFLSVSSENNPLVRARMHGQIVSLNKNDPLQKEFLRGAPKALQYYLLATIISTIEMCDDNLKYNSLMLDQAVHASIIDFMQRLNKPE